ncbi:MDR family oxidoreductase [Geminisphaera colitermitum]|uniref:acrylyl-CoA reductase (NADPH) n=1 Tax=Geminisphaera colitermitum TaxID=1148786 RepID=UPI0005BD6DC0|nr:MDR family oxidoreductase [Geminisphaera colitermitum]
MSAHPATTSAFTGILIEKNAAGTTARLTTLDEANLPPGEVMVRVTYSSLNYKDALAIHNRAPIVRAFPMVPGVDLAGTVEHSTSPDFAPGEQVFLNGQGVGENHWGGLAQKARVPAAYLLKIPAPLTPASVMAVGTAGYTAMLCVAALERAGVTPAAGDVLVTGASGGVGGFAVALLAARGFRVIASTGRVEESDYLKQLGAAEVIDRATLSSPGKPLQKERWAAAVDTVGSHTLANVCAGTKYRGVVTACGMAQGLDFPASVAPFILRHVSLLGIDAVRTPRAEQETVWARIARELDPAKLALLTNEVPLSDAIPAAARLLEGKVRGRVVVAIP